MIDVATDEIETPEQVAAMIGEAMQYVAEERIVPCTNCGMAPMRRDMRLASSPRSARAPRWRGGRSGCARA